MKTTFHLALDDNERSMIIRSLNSFRNRLIAQGKYTDGVDDVLVKVIGAKKKIQNHLYGGLITMKEMNVRYQNQGNYRLPCITTKEQKELHIGVWANRHRQYLKQHHRIKYYNLLTSERLYPYLADIEKQVQTMFSRFHSLSKHLPKRKVLQKN